MQNTVNKKEFGISTKLKNLIVITLEKIIFYVLVEGKRFRGLNLVFKLVIRDSGINGQEIKVQIAESWIMI